jgi:hypothetical protein
MGHHEIMLGLLQESLLSPPRRLRTGVGPSCLALLCVAVWLLWLQTELVSRDCSVHWISAREAGEKLSFAIVTFEVRSGPRYSHSLARLALTHR